MQHQPPLVLLRAPVAAHPSFRLKTPLAVPAVYLALISCASPPPTLLGPVFLWTPSWCWQRGALSRSDSTLGRPDSMAPGFNNTGLRSVVKVKENLAAIKTTYSFSQSASASLNLSVMSFLCPSSFYLALSHFLDFFLTGFVNHIYSIKFPTAAQPRNV